MATTSKRIVTVLVYLQRKINGKQIFVHLALGQICLFLPACLLCVGSLGYFSGLAWFSFSPEYAEYDPRIIGYIFILDSGIY